MATAAIGPWSHSCSASAAALQFLRCVMSLTYVTYAHGCALCIYESETRLSLPASAKSAAPLRVYTRPRAHYDSLLGPFVGSPVLRFHFALFFVLATAAAVVVAVTVARGRLQAPLFPGLYHPLALHPARLVGAADTCRASASATSGKERKKKEKREERIKESKGPNKVSLKTRPREKTRGREGERRQGG